jgi:hypothetical protein
MDSGTEIKSGDKREDFGLGWPVSHEDERCIRMVQGDLLEGF